ncbi:MAG TPA: STAS domain-containing protein [Spongiibacteraceae bacterium]|jgi:anti-anti-sigma factor
MAITAKRSNDGAELIIEVEGRFDFSAHQEFRKAYEVAGAKPRKFVVDMHRANYLDSSALGMLLLLRDYAGGDDSQIQIANCNPEVKNILTVSNFDQLFNLV